jgi:flagellar biosynthesis chaperone FliJ
MKNRKKVLFMKKRISLFLVLLILIVTSSVGAAIINEGIDESISGLPGLPALPDGAAEGIRNRQLAMEEIKAALLQRREAISQKRLEVQAKREAYMNKRQEYTAFRVQLRMRREESLFLMRQNNLLRSENARLKANLKAAVASLDEQGIVLSEETVHALKLHGEQLREMMSLIQETQGQIQSVVSANKGFMQEKDYVRMEIAFDEITSIQQYRNQYLHQINDTLKAMLQLIIAEA